ncbi:MAG: TlpA family protein disulfide reductase [Candidatus Parabeggiatoa sp. nov. 1]|nr:MAG: TlpA family protein disulfide reductase [Gammaproteobacteria bacterium]
MKFTYLILLATLVITAGVVSITKYNSPQQKDEPLFRPDFSLPDLQGKIRTNSEWDGKVVVVNFWATWCPPCRKEIPLFIDWQKQYAEQGLQFVGIAIDNQEAVQNFVDTMDMNYPVLVGEYKAIPLAQNFGNRIGALPFTAVVDRAGKIVWRYPGEVTQTQVEQIILPLL